MYTSKNFGLTSFFSHRSRRTWCFFLANSSSRLTAFSSLTERGVHVGHSFDLSAELYAFASLPDELRSSGAAHSPSSSMLASSVALVDWSAILVVCARRTIISGVLLRWRLYPPHDSLMHGLGRNLEIYPPLLYCIRYIVYSI